VDTYRNLSYKTISGLKWVTHYCPASSYVLKIDDHVFVNIFNLIRELQEVNTNGSHIFGDIRYRSPVARGFKSVAVAGNFVFFGGG